MLKVMFAKHQGRCCWTTQCLHNSTECCRCQVLQYSSTTMRHCNCLFALDFLVFSHRAFICFSSTFVRKCNVPDSSHNFCVHNVVFFSWCPNISLGFLCRRSCCQGTLPVPQLINRPGEIGQTMMGNRLMICTC